MGENPITNWVEEGPAWGVGEGPGRGAGATIHFGDSPMDTPQSGKQAAPCFPVPLCPPWGLLKGRWAWVVEGFFYPGLWKDTNCSACYLPSIFLTFTVPSCLLLSCQVCHPPCPSFWLPAPPDCLVIYFASFCVSFSVLSVFCRFL